MDDAERISQQRENEINRLIESMGQEEPIKGILTDDEILKYAGESNEAARIRLKRGIGTFQDKTQLHGDTILIMWFPTGLVLLMLSGSFSLMDGNILALIIFIILLVLLVGYPIYVLYIKDYVEVPYAQVIESEEKQIEEPKISNDDELLLLFESKEKIAREMIERKFPAPQMTNTKFNGVLDNCKEVVESQIEILSALTPTDKTKHEIDSRKKLIKQVISKIDDLTNELILSEESKLEEVIEDMDNLIASVNDYN